MFWNRITGPSNVVCAQANIFVHSGELGVRSPAMKRFIRSAKARRAGVGRERRSVSCTTSFSVCSLRRAKFSIIYPDLRLDYKVATQPSGESHKRKTPRDRLWSHYSPLSILGKRLFFSDIDICKSIVQTYHQEDLDERNQVERYGIAAFDPIGNKGVT